MYRATHILIGAFAALIVNSPASAQDRSENTSRSPAERVAKRSLENGDLERGLNRDRVGGDTEHGSHGNQERFTNKIEAGTELDNAVNFFGGDDKSDSFRFDDYKTVKIIGITNFYFIRSDIFQKKDNDFNRIRGSRGFGPNFESHELSAKRGITYAVIFFCGGTMTIKTIIVKSDKLAQTESVKCS